jgi:D-threo-aldose 1-dehydrogenase
VTATRLFDKVGGSRGVLGLGGGPLGNLGSAIGDEQASGTIERAWERGIRYFDTAPHYGLGISERRLGRALADRPRDEFLISTKGNWSGCCEVRRTDLRERLVAA